MSQGDFLLEADEPARATDSTAQAASATPQAATPPLAGQQMCALPADLLEKLVAAITPRPFRKRHPLLFWGGLALLFLALLGGLASWTQEEGDAIAVVRVEGMIADTRPLLKWINTVHKKSRFKAVLVRIDSPGGGAAASQELYAALRKLGKSRPMAVSMGSTAASGGYMAAVAAPHVVANPSTVTGSIGVRMDIPQVQELLAKIGVGSETLTTGALKAAGSPIRPLTPAEREYFLGILRDMHQQFVDIVAEGRGLPREVVAKLADGRIMTGREAHTHKLVDALGGQEVAVTWLREQARLEADIPLVEAPRKGELVRDMLESWLGLPLPQSRAAFLYQW